MEQQLRIERKQAWQRLPTAQQTEVQALNFPALRAGEAASPGPDQEFAIDGPAGGLHLLRILDAVGAVYATHCHRFPRVAAGQSAEGG